jgi:hypothetical protein
MMKKPHWGALLIIIFFVSAYAIIAGEAIAKESVIKLDVTAPQKISLSVGKALVIETPSAVKRVSLAATAFADAIVLSPRPQSTSKSIRTSSGSRSNFMKCSPRSKT